MEMFYHYRYPDKTMLLVVTLYALPVLAAVTESAGDNFSNNLLSDLAPLIALFGEQVAKQYLGQSMHWLEHVIFACAPLGMITAITCAIRVAGNKTLKAIIGRAREPGAQAEIEVMSSTSPDVCELWNGIGIVRVAGSPDIIELLYDRENAGSVVDIDTQNHHGVYARKDVLEPSLDKHNCLSRSTGHPHLLWMMLGRLFASGRRDPDSESYPLLADIAAPNISLNTTNPSVEKWELRLIALVGVVLQAGVMVFDWTTVSYSGWQWNKDGYRAPKHAFPLMLVGTLGVFVGMFLCAYVIEKSTVENEWRVESGDERPLQILWLQRGQTVNDQKFKSYAIYAARGRKSITTSRPLESKEKHYHILTTLSAVISVCGFVLQFVGLRAMHYSATLCQLLAMGIMTMLRVVLRRNLTTKLQTFKIGPSPSWNKHYVKELPKGHELDFIAKQMVHCSVWNVVTRDLPEPHVLEPGPTGPISRVLKARIRLGQMAGSTWKTKIHGTVVSLVETIEAIMNHLWSPSGGGILPVDKDLDEFYWDLPVTTTNESATISSFLKLRISRSRVGGELGPWRVNREDMEAVFSLWISYLRESHITEEGENLWVIGTTGEGGNDVGHVLCDWWISREIDSIDLPTIDEVRDTREIRNSRILYCMEQAPPAGTLQGIINTTSLRRMCAQFILSKFMTAAAKKITPIESETTIEPITGKRLLKVSNNDVDGLAEIFTRSGLATIDDAYRIIVPALFEADTLPNILDRVPEILDHIKRFGDENPDESNHMHMGKVCARIRNLCVNKVSVLIAQKNYDQGRRECMKLVKALVVGLGRDHPETRVMRLYLRTFGRKLTEDLIELESSSADFAASERATDTQTNREDILFPLHYAIRIGRARDLYEALINDEGRDIDELSSEGKTPLSKAVQRGDETLVKILLSFGADPASRDSENQTALHLVMSPSTRIGRQNIIKLLLDNGAGINEQNSEGKTPLHLLVAIEGDEEEIAKLLVERGADLDQKDCFDRSAVHMAAEVDNQAIVKFLVARGADPDVKDKDGRSATHKAAEKGCIKVVKFLIEKGSDQFTRDKSGKTAMHSAAGSGCGDVVKYLLNIGVDPDSRDKLGRTAMHSAVERGEESIVEFFLNEGSDPDVKDHCGQTAMHKAAAEGHEVILRLLVQGGGDLNAKDEDSRTPIHSAAEKGHKDVLLELIDLGCDPDSRDNTGTTPMQIAAISGHKAIVELLIQNGADPDTKDKHGRTAIHKVAEVGQQKLVELFLEKGSNPDNKDIEGRTAIHLAAQHGHRSTVELLIQGGGNLDVRDELGKTALYLAAGAGKITVVKLLLENGSDPSITNNHRETALHIAVRNGHEDIAKLLLSQPRINRDIKDMDGRTAIHTAAEMGRQECVRLLIEEDVNLLTRDKNGDTAIHTAASNGYEAVIQLLLDSGATLNIKNVAGRTPLHKAAEGGYGGVIKVLLGNGAHLGARDNDGKTPMNIAEGNGKDLVKKLLVESRPNHYF